MTTAVTEADVRPDAARAAGLEAELTDRGYRPGFPPHLTEDTRSTDRRVCRALVCPGCRRRGLECRPFHKAPPRASYRVVAACPRCGAAEEV